MVSEVDNPELKWFIASYMSCGKEEDQALDSVPKEIEFYAFGKENNNVLVLICTTVKLKYIIKNRGRYPPVTQGTGD